MFFQSSTFFENSYIGVKDLKIIDENIYISFSKKISEDCYNTSILKGNKNLEKINFEKFFSPKSCVSGKNDFGVNGKWAQGGRIINFNSEEILFTVGTWGQENLAQDKQSVFGKILAIDLRKMDILKNVSFLQCDFKKEETKEKIMNFFGD